MFWYLFDLRAWFTLALLQDKLSFLPFPFDPLAYSVNFSMSSLYFSLILLPFFVSFRYISFITTHTELERCYQNVKSYQLSCHLTEKEQFRQTWWNFSNCLNTERFIQNAILKKLIVLLERYCKISPSLLFLEKDHQNTNQVVVFKVQLRVMLLPYKKMYTA